ncbi:ImmA/IrrE family metallo-endopeptidase [Caldicoprobacter algeriensis]|uniref:ImmA/IrrE family metallo-endopeptidase n=1 Tax=Caldicoprobacter algeriensis TaxID=699281 RepID=UPI00207A50D0|nr:ImmA/IrrE family metallo-endopeptidase [Caldicoprobacter algeriensis]MCM8901293.1 ImmA/IrrE family metallo-endopeptidase [Caldicoprobacter algeriensis]
MKKNIHARVKHLVQKYETRDPLRLAKYLNIHVVHKEYSPHTKGYYIKTIKNKFIVVNSTLDEHSQRIVLAHELGHAILHSSEPIYFVREYTLFPIGPYEAEANKFAAELLIDDYDIKEIRYEPINLIASALKVNEKLVEYKLNSEQY